MSDGAEKPFAPSASRRKRAVREGNVARSHELAAAASFGAGLLAASAAVPVLAGALASALRAASSSNGMAGASPQISAPLCVAAACALTPLAAAATGGTLFALVQGGGLHIGGLSLDPKRVDPIAGLKRMLGGEAVVAAARAAAAFALALVALAPLGHDIVAAGITARSPSAIASVAWTAALRACMTTLGVALVFGLADYALAHRRWLRGLKMSFDELKRDTKENDGDPHARSRRKTLHRDLVRGAIARTREASFVVVNPTHVAVALRYAPPAIPVPEILVRALDDAALRVRAIARESDVPVVENAPLARLLYATSARSRTIAPETYVAVAQIVADLAQAGLLE
jgi:flagellar biosynthesis protein FlhB